MTSARDNADLTRVGPGTLMGDLMRQYWIPACLSSELEAGGSPIRLLLLGEQLVAFRDQQGRVGIMDHRCPHRCASLFFGRPDGSYAEAAFMAGVAATDWSWSPVFMDVDLDGYEDFLVTNGFEFDAPRTMWLYRDWVIDALNRDLPFDQFTVEQLAGDLLPDATDAQRIATGFLRNSAVAPDVLTHRFEAIVQEMGEAMLRTAYSQILNSSRDFSTAICDDQARLVAQAEHVPIHVGAIPWAVASVRDAFAGRVHPGDVFLLNDPYHGNNHLPDLTAFVPVFVEDRVAFWSVNRAHQSDIGGSTHGAYNPAATEIWQEGIRITPLKLYDRGELRDDVLQMVVTNVRHPHDFMGDLRAMIGSARVGERRLLALVESYGAKTVIGAVDEILDGAERQARACVRGWKDGVYKGVSILDDDGHGATDIAIRATVPVQTCPPRLVMNSRAGSAYIW